MRVATTVISFAVATSVLAVDISASASSIGKASQLSVANDPTPKAAERPRDEVTITPYVGKSSTRNSSLLVRHPNEATALNYANVKWNDESFENPLYYGFKVTVWPKGGDTGLGYDFIHYKVYADTDRETLVSGTLNGAPYSNVEPIRNTISRFSISHGVNYLMLNVLKRRQFGKSDEFPTGRANVYGGIGGGIVINHPESRIGGDFFQKYQFGGYSWQLLAGAEYKVNSKYSVFAEYKFTDYHARVQVARQGTAETHLRTHHLAFGTTIRLK